MVAPAYLFACLVLGGSAQGIWQNMLLQLAGVAIIAWAALDIGEEPLSLSARQLLIIAIAAVAVAVAQLIPLPPKLWIHLGPREGLAEGFSVLGIPLPSEPLSMAPMKALDSLLGIIPPLAVVCAMVRLRAYRPQWLAVALIGGTIAGIVLGAMQVANSNSELTPWYLYEDTNPGRGVGFFANADHMATLLVVTIPFLAAMVAAAKTRSMQRYSAIIAVAAGLAIVILVGLALNRSLAGYGLALPVVAGSALIIIPAASRSRIWIIGLASLLVIGAVVGLETTAIGSGHIGEHASTAVQSRAELLSQTTRAARDFMPFGSGLGSFQSVYPLYERPEQVTTTYVIHAHNDYAEIALELGIAGIILILVFFGWWAAAAWRAWRSVETGPFAKAAAIASAAVLIHSFVDFPSRTAAIAAVFAMCLSLLANSRGAPPAEEAQLRGSRHVEFK